VPPPYVAIAKHIPPNAKRVLEYGVGQGRNLYYYPKVGAVQLLNPVRDPFLTVVQSFQLELLFCALHFPSRQA
jgi:hypothetical protein